MQSKVMNRVFVNGNKPFIVLEKPGDFRALLIGRPAGKRQKPGRVGRSVIQFSWTELQDRLLKRVISFSRGLSSVSNTLAQNINSGYDFVLARPVFWRDSADRFSLAPSAIRASK